MKKISYYKEKNNPIMGKNCHILSIGYSNKYHLLKSIQLKSIPTIQFNYSSYPITYCNCSSLYINPIKIDKPNTPNYGNWGNQTNQLKGTIEMKAIKHHLVNWQSGKTICGLNFKSDSIRLASNESNEWFDDFGNQLDVSDYESIFCINCLKLHETDLIEQFKMESFMIQFDLQLPNTKRQMNRKKSQSRFNRRNGIKTESITDSIDKETKAKPNPIITPTKSKPTNSIPKSAKGIARDKRKESIAKSNPIDTPTESKCKVISKPKEKEKPIELVNEVKPLIDLSNGPKTIEVIEEVPIDDSFLIGDPIDDDSILELGIDTNWKLVRHNKELNLWKLQTKSINKKNKVSKWIDDTEYCPYEFISDIINSGYCE